VPDPEDRPDFYAWYGESHSLEGMRQFGFRRFWRCWSHLDPSIHCAFYELSDTEHYDRIEKSPAFAAMVDDFSATWDGKVTRVRDVMQIVQKGMGADDAVPPHLSSL